MTIRIAINGYGRIGRNIMRALYEGEHKEHLSIIAINDLGDASASALLTEYDSVHGHFGYSVTASDNKMFIDNDEILILKESDPSNLNWGDLDIDIVFECTGRFTTREDAAIHLKQGAKKVLISAPGKDADATIVYGVNHEILTAEHLIVSNASCTTNCLAPMAQVLNQHIGIQQGIMTTIHSYTNDQHLSDVYTNDIYRARAAALSMIPTRTGAAEAVSLVLPELAGKLSGLAVRVPTANVSLIDLSFTPSKNTSLDEINNLMQHASLDNLQGVLAYNELPLVSVDFNHNPASCIFDSTQSIVSDGLIKVFAWYDNEWGFSNRMLDTARAMSRV
ncbi:type I glyceraldehyde-3-phosphate dehydrogenase [Neptunomonas sp.]|uniref:type I glyceraldehyde-3-phosphate dehydrogenase n=1 Tax=Neptunomonas sp. TaxID=1971898 RepID=UPI0025DA5C36|nr:type I glyceraldehyde-3-phosphate dehydrogenase [Neptunomonas sp.]